MSDEEQEPVLTSWEAAQAKMRRVVAASSDPFDLATVRNAEYLFTACRDRIQAPVEVEKGYWSTICVWWEGIEVEVFDDRYELYVFRDRATDIEYFAMSSEEPVPEKLVERLPCLKIEG
ncbi:hypothetical protein [Occallatibacter riparius]|uniref:Uncharacterized protein n=1 Tax=Occallatibacter riparius TaxID=1002689 RepID=A0A9J7BML3_9BACT|nr:hypothetical protein [Occallatibacter riparius]UWZ83879.1 hypothetical protein MOP44_25395 [Occallatibacter riparius]